MLSRKNRANPAEIVLAREEGRLISGPLFGLLVYDLDDSRPSRFAFIVSLKTAKKAVERNKIKRKLREVIRLKIDKIKDGKLGLFLVKKETVGRRSEEIKIAVAAILKKAGFLK
ncbi:MAG: ribonuclease P protein component [Candidatus Pacebacteria bacterium]|nr:ribonuclease P protein component [Candidatus Paceibacterota bacterium]